MSLRGVLTREGGDRPAATPSKPPRKRGIDDAQLRSAAAIEMVDRQMPGNVDNLADIGVKEVAQG